MRKFAAGGAAGTPTGASESLANWAGPYVTEMLGRGQALASQPYQAYTGDLTAGPSALQTQAFQGVAGLTIPTSAQTTYNPQTFTADVAQTYMNPYLTAALQPQLDEARRQADISRLQTVGRMARSGAYGGGRQAIAEAELQRGLGANLANITGQGYRTAYDQAQAQFNAEQQRQMQATQQAQQYGLAALGRQAELGGLQRGIEQEGLSAEQKQFEEERMYPYKQVQYMQSLLQGLPIAAQQYSYSEPGVLSSMLGSAKGLKELYEMLFPTK
jgi:hypothetical protein